MQTGSDFDDWMAHFSEQDQKLLRAFDERFYGLYQGRDPNQIAWMAAHGYPMPEDVLAAQFVSTAALRAMAGQGNIKAALMPGDGGVRQIIRSFVNSDSNPSVRDYRQALAPGASNLLSHFSSQQGQYMIKRAAGLPTGICAELFDGNDPYPVPHPPN